MNKQRKADILDSLKNWSTFHPIVSTLTIEEVEYLMKTEKNNYNRGSFIERLQKRRRRLLVEQVREQNSNT